MVFMKDLHRQSRAVLSGSPLVFLTAPVVLEQDLYSLNLNLKVS